jgi:hypothetical protein
MASRATQYRPVAPALREQRQSARHIVELSGATIRRHGDQSASAELRDLSIYGCRIACDEPLRAGERVWLRFEGSMPVAANVVWSDGGMTGCRFDVPLARSLLRTLTLSLG